jgi:tRNA U34 2-thiouridine synthase MnmA/TrmU
MAVEIHKRVYNNISRFYYNVRRKYPNTNSYKQVLDQINKVYNEAYNVGTKLQKVNPSTTYVISKWKGYNVDYSKNTGWYFAYKIQNNTVYVYDAENGRNMSDEAYTSQNNTTGQQANNNQVQQTNTQTNQQETTVINKPLTEQKEIKASLDFMWRLLKCKFW